MIPIAAFVLGAILGAITVRRRGGNRLDMAQYAAGFGIAFGVVALFAMILLGQLL